MKLVHHVLVVYVLALLQRETVATVKIEGEDHAHPEWETIDIPDTLKVIGKKELGTWRAYAKGKENWKVEVDEIRTEIQFQNRHEIYKGKKIVLLIYKLGYYTYDLYYFATALKINAAAEFARHNVRNGIVLVLRNHIVHDYYIDKLDPMTKEIFALNDFYLYFEMENKIQIVDVVNKDDLEKRHDTYRGRYIFTIYYDKDDDVRVGEYQQFQWGQDEDVRKRVGKKYQQFQWGPLKEYVSYWHLKTAPLYTRSVFLKVKKESVLKGDTEFFQKICQGKGEPKKYPVVYLESDRKLHSITYLEEGWKHGPVLNDCAKQESNYPLQKP